MISTENIQVDKDLANKKIAVTRYFEATPDLVWRAWTEADLLDLWWAPKPWRAETKEMNFADGGYWLYSMVGPAGERQYCKVDFSNIDTEKSFDSVDYFCDENGTPNDTMPTMFWHVKFYAEGDGTKVVVELKFEKEEDMQKILEMGFEQGFLMALGNLEEYFASIK